MPAFCNDINAAAFPRFKGFGYKSDEVTRHGNLHACIVDESPCSARVSDKVPLPAHGDWRKIGFLEEIDGAFYAVVKDVKILWC